MNIPTVLQIKESQKLLAELKENNVEDDKLSDEDRLKIIEENTIGRISNSTNNR